MACAFFAEFNKIQKEAFRKALTSPVAVENNVKIEQPTKVPQKPRGRPPTIKKVAASKIIINPQTIIAVKPPTVIEKIQTSTSSVEFSSSSSSINETASPIAPPNKTKVPKKIKIPSINKNSPITKEIPIILKESENSPKTPTAIQKESPKPQQNLSGKRKRQTSFKEADESLNLSETRRRKYSTTDSSFYETPRRSFMRSSLDANGQDSGLRRGRSKNQANLSAVEVPEKLFEEYNQDDFLCIFGLVKVV